MRPLLAVIAGCSLLLLGFVGHLPTSMVEAQEGTPAAAERVIEVALQDVNGQDVGIVAFEEGADGVQVTATLRNLPPGEHGLHVHETGICDPGGDAPFSSAGAHFSPVEAPHGEPPTEEELATPPAEHTDHVAHAGDLGNITIEENGAGMLELLTNRFTLTEGPTSLADEDGSAIVVHADPDNLTSQPSGESGTRIACGVIFAPAGGAAATPEAEADEAAMASFEIRMVDIAFNPRELTIPADTDVTIVLPNDGAAVHNFVIDELDIHSGDVAPGSTVEVVINAPAGEYEYYCGIPGHRAAGMWGTLIVE